MSLKIKFLFAWYDLWIGVFIDRRQGVVYIFPLPMVGCSIHLLPDHYSIKRLKTAPKLWAIYKNNAVVWSQYKTWFEAMKKCRLHYNAHLPIQKDKDMNQLEKSPSFRGEFLFLSNFYPCYITMGGRTYPTAEHAYCSFKASYALWKNACASTKYTPAEIKKQAEKMGNKATWQPTKVSVMEEVVRAKFQQNKHLATLLVLTGSTELVERNNWGDTFWGTCNGKGTNHLGKILMKIRQEITMP